MLRFSMRLTPEDTETESDGGTRTEPWVKLAARTITAPHITAPQVVNVNPPAPSTSPSVTTRTIVTVRRTVTVHPSTAMTDSARPSSSRAWVDTATSTQTALSEQLHSQEESRIRTTSNWTGVLTQRTLPSTPTGTAQGTSPELTAASAGMEWTTDNSLFAISRSTSASLLARLEDASAQKTDSATPTFATSSTASQLDSHQLGHSLSLPSLWSLQLSFASCGTWNAESNISLPMLFPLSVFTPTLLSNKLR
jgi:hypothetical protein